MSGYMREEHHCDMCLFFHDDGEIGECSRYHEEHFPTDGAYCGGWKYWKDEENETGRD